MHDLDSKILRQLLGAVGAHLEASGTSVGIVVVGGAALSLRGWVPRTTHDVDVLALVRETDGELEAPHLPADLQDAVVRVARDFGLPRDWLNVDVGAQWRTGLPERVADDLEWQAFGGLQVGLAGRRTLIALKLHAAADHGPESVHTQDLVALSPTDAELDSARQWVDQQDALEEFPRIVDQVIDHVRRHRRSH